MAVWKCDRCSTITILTDGALALEMPRCPRLDCDGTVSFVDEPMASSAVLSAFYGHDHGFSCVPAYAGPLGESFTHMQNVNAGLARIAAVLRDHEDSGG